MKDHVKPIDRDELIERALVNHLLLYAVGHENAIPRDRILERINSALRPWDPQEAWKAVDDATMRRIAANSKAGIFASQDGYFLPASGHAGVAELTEFEDYIMKKVRGLYKRIAVFRKAHPDLGPFRFQLPLFTEADVEADEAD